MIWEQLTKVFWLGDSDAIVVKLLVGLMSHSSVLTDYSQARRPRKKGWQRPQHLVQYGWVFRETSSHTYCITHTPLTHLAREGPTWGYKHHNYRATGLLSSWPSQLCSASSAWFLLESWYKWETMPKSRFLGSNRKTWKADSRYF